MMEIFKVVPPWVMVGWVVSLIGLYYAVRRDLDSLKKDVGAIIERNKSADTAIQKLEAETEARLGVTETRLTGHDVILGRVDERWNSMQKSLEKIETSLDKLAAR